MRHFWMFMLLFPFAAQTADAQEISGRWESVVATRRDTVSGIWNTTVGDRPVTVPNVVRHVNLVLVEQFDFQPDGIVRFTQRVTDYTRVFEKGRSGRLMDVTHRFLEAGRENISKALRGFYVFRRESRVSGVLTVWFPDSTSAAGSGELVRFAASVSREDLSLQDSSGEIVHYRRIAGIPGPPSARREPAAGEGEPDGGDVRIVERVVTVRDTVVVTRTVYDTVFVGGMESGIGTAAVYDTVKVIVHELPGPVDGQEIPGLSAISISPGWVDWDADAALDGILVRIFPKDSLGGAMLQFEDGIPLAVEVKLYTDNNRDGAPETPPVYSARFEGTASDFLRSKFVRVPAELISVDPLRDYRYGIMDVSLITPKQGRFSARAPFVELYR